MSRRKPPKHLAEGFASRLKRVIEERAEGNQSRFARMIGMKSQTISAMTSGKSLPDSTLVIQLAERTNYPVCWWLLGHQAHEELPAVSIDALVSKVLSITDELLTNGDVPPKIRRKLIVRLISELSRLIQ